MILSVIDMRDPLVVLDGEMGLAAIVAAIAVKTVKTLRIMTDVKGYECRRQYQGRTDGRMSSTWHHPGKSNGNICVDLVAKARARKPVPFTGCRAFVIHRCAIVLTMTPY